MGYGGFARPEATSSSRTLWTGTTPALSRFRITQEPTLLIPHGRLSGHITTRWSPAQLPKTHTCETARLAYMEPGRARAGWLTSRVLGGLHGSFAVVTRGDRPSADGSRIVGRFPGGQMKGTFPNGEGLESQC